MEPMVKPQHYDWSLMIGLGCLVLIHPLLNLSGLMSLLGRPLGPWLVTAVISAIWVATVVLSRVRAPLATLALTGLISGLAVLAVSALLAPVLTSWPSSLMRNPIAVMAVLAANTLWGTIAGLVAVVLRRALGIDRGNPN